MPVREIVVVHPDQGFLDDLTGELHEYVADEVNVRALTPCADAQKYCSVRAEPEWGVLGKRLGKSMGAVAKAVKALPMEDILAYENGGSLTVEGFEMGPGDMKILRDFQPPAGSKPEDMDAAGDGEVLVVMDLRSDEGLVAAGLAREVVNRVQRLRKKAGLQATDAVHVWISVTAAPAGAPDVAAALASQDGYVQEALGFGIQPASQQPADEAVLGSEDHSLGGDGGKAEFTLVLTRPGSSGGVGTAAAALQAQAL